MKKIFLWFVLLGLALGTFGCTGGAGTPERPSGENSGIPSSIQLLPAQYVAQTNSTIYLKARVFDGNGHPLTNIPVTFTNLTEGSASHVLTAASLNSLTTLTGSSVREARGVSVVTDYDGFATASLFSPVAGFVTVQAEINVGSDQVRDKKTVFFSGGSLLYPPPTIILDVDSNFNGIYNEPDDFTLLDGPDDNQAAVRATVYDEFGGLVGAGFPVTFVTDSSEVTFPLGNVLPTDSNGQATVLVTVTPSVLRPITTVVNVGAYASVHSQFDAFNMVTLFLEPVVIEAITLSADPQTVASGGTSEVSAAVSTSAGTPAPNGTTVNFVLASHGTIEPFGQTTAGVATVTYTAPTLSSGSSSVTDHVTASVGGFTSDPLTITVAAPFVVNSQSATATQCASPAMTVSFTIQGGVGPYTVESGDADTAFNGTAGNGTWTVNGTSFTVTLKQGASSGTVSLTVKDSLGSSAIATLTIKTETLTATPSHLDLHHLGSDDVQIAGGTEPYSISDVDDPTPVLTAPSTGQFAGDTFTVTADTTDGDATITVEDALCYTTTVTVTVSP
jgi:hypothetical protein